jgi:hypothetical protein
MGRSHYHDPAHVDASPFLARGALLPDPAALGHSKAVVQMGNLAHDRIMRSITLFDRHVIPALA